MSWGCFWLSFLFSSVDYNGVQWFKAGLKKCKCVVGYTAIYERQLQLNYILPIPLHYLLQCRAGAMGSCTPPRMPCLPWTFISQSVLSSVCFFLTSYFLISNRCLWTHTGSKHSPQKCCAGRGQPKSNALRGEAALSRPPGQIRLVLPAAVHGRFGQSQLLGSGLGSRRGYRSDLLESETQGCPWREQTRVEREVVEFGVDW